MISLIFLTLLILALLLAFALRLSIKSASKHYSTLICVVVPLLVLSVIIVLIVESSMRRTIENRELKTLLEAVEISKHGNHLYDSESEKHQYMDSLKMLKNKLTVISENDSLLGIFLGEDSEMQNRISRAQTALSNQEKRYSRLNPIDTATYYVAHSVKSDSLIRLIEPDNTELPVLNIAYIPKEQNRSTVASVLMLIKGDSVLFHRNYKSQLGVNAFLFPNLLDEGTELRIGYLTREAGVNTFHYVNYTPNEQ